MDYVKGAEQTLKEVWYSLMDDHSPMAVMACKTFVEAYERAGILSAENAGWTRGARLMTTMLTNDPQRRFVRRFCELYIQKLRALLKKNPPKESPCSTCAFAPKTDSWQGFEATIWDLMQAIMHRRPFYCHRNMESVDGEYKLDLSKAIPCAGYEAIRHCPEATDAIREAAVESGPLSHGILEK